MRYNSAMASLARLFSEICSELDTVPTKEDARMIFDLHLKQQKQEPVQQSEETQPQPSNPFEKFASTEEQSEADCCDEEDDSSSSSEDAVTIYTLELEEGKFYVGRCQSHRIDERIQEHFNNKGSAWTSMYKPVSVLSVSKNCSVFDEDSETLKLMSEKGYDCVRGGKYVSCVLSEQDMADIERSIRSATNLCLCCGSADHFIADCPKKTVPTQRRKYAVVKRSRRRNCSRCGRYTHTKAKCYATSHYNGRALTD